MSAIQAMKYQTRVRKGFWMFASGFAVLGLGVICALVAGGMSEVSAHFCGLAAGLLQPIGFALALGGFLIVVQNSDRAHDS